MYVSLNEALTKGHGEWRSFTCPIHDDSTPSARVNVTTGKWICMVCGTKGKSTNYEPPERLVIDKVRRLDSETPVIAESFLDLFDSTGPGEYWSQRFTQEACEHFRLGYDSVQSKSVYPIRNIHGEPLGVVHRNHPGEKPKYRYPRGINTSELLFGYHEIECQTPVVVVEGAPDVIALWEIGIPAVGTFGARLLPAQQDLLEALQPALVLVAYDQDLAGRTGAGKATAALLSQGVRAKTAFWRGYNDPGEMPADTRKEIFEKCLARG